MGLSRKPFKVAGKTSWFYKIDGRRLSLKTKSYSEALKLLACIRKAYNEGKLLRISGHSTKTLGSFRDEYLEWAYEVQPEKTFKANRLALKKVIQIEGSNVRLDRLTMKTMDELKRVHRHLKSSTVNNYLRHAKAVLNKAVEWGYLQKNPFRGAKELPKAKAAANYLTQKQLTGFLASVEDVDLRRLIAAYLATGRRRAELFRLRWEDIRWDENRYFVAREKRHLCRFYPMSSAFKAVLESMPRERGRIFSKWSHPDTFTHKVKEALRAAGLGNLRLHDLRHSFAVVYLETGGDMKSLQALLGHSEFRMTADIYAHVADEELHKAVNLVKLGPVDLFGPSNS